ncbi:MAG: response regulator, partial [Elusimicrobiota bacterium]
VNTATNGKNALEILRELNIDVVITDLNMPVMGGNDLLNVIKNDYPSTEIIIITAMPTVDSVINILKSGASDYIVKPINFDLLLTNLKKIFDKKELLSKLNTEKVLKEKISSLLDDYQDLFISTIKSLSEAIEAKDIHTQGHCERISNNSIAIAKKLSLHFDEIRDIQFAALLHDVGKIAIP